MTERQTGRIRQLLARSEPLLLIGVFDALSAKVAQDVGFPAVFISGAGVSASLLGASDVGLLTMAEVLDQARHIVQAVSIPVLCDCDTGYGSVTNVARTVREFEAAGLAGIMLEDQVWPKRCGHFEDKQTIPIEEMAAKIRAAVATRSDPDFVLIARTDARATENLGAAIARAQVYLNAGADVLFVEAPTSEEELRIIGSSLDAPLMANMVEGGKTPILPADRLASLGFKIVIFPGSAIRAAIKAMREVAQSLLVSGSTAAVADRLIGFEERNRLLGLAAIRDFEASFRSTGM